MSWNPQTLAAAMALSHVFPRPEIFGDGIDVQGDRHAMFLAIVADYLDAGVESGCIPSLTVIEVKETGCVIDITIRVASIINADAA
ncbi:hypothetical protein [Paenirhodobacter populi]|uniref:Uncharacterized protein n=1 Tax=Paenirhodobacter populi TaxID=2306993 RepID=A0A443J7J2_9RHOB|nr:hypothetical protein [Sinirhodobacter populi]RWR16461.1 hypothetical protein D2T30_21655 [Sinirhodobacter populi]